MRILISVLFLLFMPALVAHGHNGVIHKNAEEEARHKAASQPADNSPLFPKDIGGQFDLIDHNGNPRTQVNPLQQPQLIFFGYATCQAICTVALPRMVDTVDILAGKGVLVTPVLITVDPKQDTIASLPDALAKYHPRLIGLTGAEEKLQSARKAFHVEASLEFTHPEHGPVYSHGSFIYLMDKEGEFLTILPPVLSAQRMAEIVHNYIEKPGH